MSDAQPFDFTDITTILAPLPWLERVRQTLEQNLAEMEQRRETVYREMAMETPAHQYVYGHVSGQCDAYHHALSLLRQQPKNG